MFKCNTNLKNIFNIEINNHKIFQMLFSFILAVLGDNQNSYQVAEYQAVQINKKLIYLVNKYVFVKLGEIAKSKPFNTQSTGKLF